MSNGKSFDARTHATSLNAPDIAQKRINSVRHRRGGRGVHACCFEALIIFHLCLGVLSSTLLWWQGRGEAASTTTSRHPTLGSGQRIRYEPQVSNRDTQPRRRRRRRRSGVCVRACPYYSVSLRSCIDETALCMSVPTGWGQPAPVCKSHERRGGPEERGRWQMSRPQSGPRREYAPQQRSTGHVTKKIKNQKQLKHNFNVCLSALSV